jgi:general secretion pathway protein F/type IV pilus assembly protein PilC
MYFLYYAIDRISQKKVRGIIEASEYSDAYGKIIDIGYIPEKITQLPKWFPISLFRTKPHMRINEIVEFLEAIGHGFNAGIQITEILIDYRNEIGRKKAQAAVQAIIEDLREGSSFSATLKNLGFFPQTVLSFIEIGENTGSLGENALEAARRVKFTEELKGEIKKAMIYPAFVMFSILGSISIWLFVVIPKIASVFKALNIKLPSYTMALINISNNKTLILYYLAGIVSFFIAINIVNGLIRKFFGKEHFILRLKDSITMRVPVVGRLIFYYNAFLISSFLSALIAAGLNISHALVIIGRAINNAIYYQVVEKIRQEIETGSTLTEAFRQHASLFPPMFIRYLLVGERTGTVDTQMNYIATIYRTKVEDILKMIPKLMEPLLITFLGIIMVGMIVAVFSPIYSSISKIMEGM